MKVTKVSYAMLRKTGLYENDRAEVEVELGPKDTFEDAVALAKAKSEAALKFTTPMEHKDLQAAHETLDGILATERGRLAFAAWRKSQRGY